jgi:DNA-binding MarR family transcriptional regulator
VEPRAGSDPELSRARTAGEFGPTGLVWLLRLTTRRFGAAVRRGLDEAGHTQLPQQGFWAVSALAERDHTAGQLVDRMQITKQAVSQLVETLVALGYVERHSDPVDRRRVVLVLTDLGREAARAIAHAIEGLQAELARDVGPDGLDQLGRILTAFTAQVPETEQA